MVYPFLKEYTSKLSTVLTTEQAVQKISELMILIERLKFSLSFLLADIAVGAYGSNNAVLLRCEKT